MHCGLSQANSYEASNCCYCTRHNKKLLGVGFAFYAEKSVQSHVHTLHTACTLHSDRIATQQSALPAVRFLGVVW